VRERVQERWVEREDLLKPSSKAARESHLSAVTNIAQEYFAYPTPEFPHLRTFVNEPEPTQKVFTNYGNELAPDIVVVQWPEKIISIVAEVATADMLTLDVAEMVWAVLARLEGVQFYLYVPAGHAGDARKLLKQAKIKGVTLRTWRHITGLQTVEIARVR
jgi:hypothetical protein